MAKDTGLTPDHAPAVALADRIGQADFAAHPTKAMAEMVAAVDDDLMRSIVSDSYRSREANSILAAGRPRPAPEVQGSGWVDPPKVADWRAPGLDTIDRMMDAQDAQDQAERRAKLGRGRPADE